MTLLDLVSGHPGLLPPPNVDSIRIRPGPMVKHYNEHDAVEYDYFLRLLLALMTVNLHNLFACILEPPDVRLSLGVRPCPIINNYITIHMMMLALNPR